MVFIEYCLGMFEKQNRERVEERKGGRERERERYSSA